MGKINWEERVFCLASSIYAASDTIKIDEAINCALEFKKRYIERFGLEEKKQEEITPKIKQTKDAMFEGIWLLYRRKGSKKKSYEQWQKLTEQEREQVANHIQAYVESVSDVKFQKDFERYLRYKCFLNVVYKDGKTIFDAENKEEIQSDSKLIIGGVEYR